MARHYSTKEFFRQMPNELLARFFQERGFFEELDFTTMKETNPQELWDAWLNLPEKDRKQLDEHSLFIAREEFSDFTFYRYH